MFRLGDKCGIMPCWCDLAHNHRLPNIVTLGKAHFTSSPHVNEYLAVGGKRLSVCLRDVPDDRLLDLFTSQGVE